jgi:hypothetical protein
MIACRAYERRREWSSDSCVRCACVLFECVYVFMAQGERTHVIELILFLLPSFSYSFQLPFRITLFASSVETQFVGRVCRLNLFLLNGSAKIAFFLRLVPVPLLPPP